MQPCAYVVHRELNGMNLYDNIAAIPFLGWSKNLCEADAALHVPSSTQPATLRQVS